MTPTFHYNPISNKKLKFINRVNKTIDNLNPRPINEVMGAAIVYEHYQYVVFNVTLDF